MVDVVCKHAFGYSIFNSFDLELYVRIITALELELELSIIFINLLAISSEYIVILIYNYFISIVFVLNYPVTKVFCYKCVLCLNNFIFRWYIPGYITECFLELNF